MYFLNKTCQIPFGNLENSQQPQCDFDGGDCYYCSRRTDGKSVPCQGRGTSKKQAGKSCTLAKYQLSCLVIPTPPFFALPHFLLPWSNLIRTQ